MSTVLINTIMYLLLLISSGAILTRYYFGHLILTWLFKIKSKFSLFFNISNLIPSNSIDGVSNDSLNNLSQTHKIVKTKSYNTLNPDIINKHYSYTYYFITKKVPQKSKSVDYINELIKNRLNNQLICCNPNCKQYIKFDTYCAYDGYYCSYFCRKAAYKYIENYWSYT